MLYALIPLKAKIAAAVLSSLAVVGTVSVTTQQSSSENGSQSVAGKAAAGNASLESEGTDVAVRPGSTTGDAIGATGVTLLPTQSGAAASAGEGGVNGAGVARAGSTTARVATPANPGDLVPPVPGPGDVVGGVPSAPDVPTVPDLGVPIPANPVGDGLAAFDHGSHTITVPGTAPVTKQLCVNGAVERCTTVSVGALQPVTFTVSFSSNVSSTPPTFTAGLCPGGVTVAVAGLTPGATVTASANGVERSKIVPSRDVAQTVSLCDA